MCILRGRLNSWKHMNDDYQMVSAKRADGESREE